jgi:hypothetical protein
MAVVNMVNAQDRGSVAATLVFGAGVLLAMGSAPAWCVALGLASRARRVLVASGRLARAKPRRGLRFRWAPSPRCWCWPWPPVFARSTAWRPVPPC